MGKGLCRGAGRRYVCWLGVNDWSQSGKIVRGPYIGPLYMLIDFLFPSDIILDVIWWSQFLPSISLLDYWLGSFRESPKVIHLYPSPGSPFPPLYLGLYLTTPLTKTYPSPLMEYPVQTEIGVSFVGESSYLIISRRILQTCGLTWNKMCTSDGASLVVLCLSVLWTLYHGSGWLR